MMERPTAFTDLQAAENDAWSRYYTRNGERGEHCVLVNGHAPHVLHNWAMTGTHYPCGGGLGEQTVRTARDMGLDPLGAGRWTAVLAPLGIRSEDGLNRGLSEKLNLTVSARPVPLLMDSPEVSLIGIVESARVRDTLLVASGIVTDPDATERMNTGDLRPQMELSDIETDDDGWFTSAALRCLRAGRSPVWPNCQFTMERDLRSSSAGKPDSDLRAAQAQQNRQDS